MVLVGVVCGPLAMARSASGKNAAAKKIWSTSRFWKYDARASGSTGKSHHVKVALSLNGKLKGKVATYEASFRFKVGKKTCLARVDGTLKKGSYVLHKSVAVVKGKIAFDKISSSCKLPQDLKKKVRGLTLPLQFGLIGRKLCVSVASAPNASTPDCFLVDRQQKKKKKNKKK
jgi:hypothetical protein